MKKWLYYTPEAGGIVGSGYLCYELTIQMHLNPILSGCAFVLAVVLVGLRAYEA